MHRIPPLLAECVLVGAIAVGTSWTWIALTSTSALSPGAVIVCMVITVAVVFAVEAVAGQVRRGRRRRAHARPHTTRKVS
ncbi:hypothetical protein DMH12_24945 [Streptomyces sp. WAC 04229]|uniref:hypothetical protein n=1 Tax=Streptomyces sp. WAC 04229 TaxID=2203206 RepID=UPI000F74633F|nr:hypothetical protein [Streptomyces sp. WAC 04229]RSN50533.1 hypothetical protein DMH12_24945 [Streptomyces sp. WAC 04229]